MSFGLDDQTAKLPITENFVTRNSKSIERLRDLTAQSARNAQFARNARFARSALWDPEFRCPDSVFGRSRSVGLARTLLRNLHICIFLGDEIRDPLR